MRARLHRNRAEATVLGVTMKRAVSRAGGNSSTWRRAAGYTANGSGFRLAFVHYYLLIGTGSSFLGKRGRGVKLKLNSHLHVELRLRTSGAIPPFPLAPS
jgi:hypothetical protein